MNKELERRQFSERLVNALENAGFPGAGPTQLARLYNSLSMSDKVTIHAARKWLVGESIPTQDKIRILAHELSVTPEWLRFGGGEHAPGAQEGRSSTLPPSLLNGFNKLDRSEQKVVIQLIETLLELKQDQ
ncbi:hypothetical protein [Noviherbaspirillum humi]|uniref:hypothetical protein n=1 Tax=Noviherbaspirillum humi TaxID=1688639 RepID=UPI000B78FBA5|nr:hypothetical protein [Noviherbaspirillum humi]